MMTANRNALKLVSQLHIDSQFYHQYGTQVFNYQGEPNEAYKKLCGEFKAIIADIESSLALVKSNLPKIE